MGFLTGAYGKLLAGKRVRQIQYEMYSITRQLNQVTRQMGQMERQLSAQERNMKNMAQMQQNYYMLGLQQAFQQAGIPIFGQNGQMSFNPTQSLTQDQQQAYMAYNQQIQNIQMQASMALEMRQQAFDQYRDMMMEPLKDLENELQIRQENLKSQLALAESQQKAHEEEEKAGVKGLTPQYTSQG